MIRLLTLNTQDAPFFEPSFVEVLHIVTSIEKTYSSKKVCESKLVEGNLYFLGVTVFSDLCVSAFKLDVRTQRTTDAEIAEKTRRVMRDTFRAKLGFSGFVIALL